MRVLVGFLSGLLGALAGWAALAMAVVGLAGPDRDGGIAMGAAFNIGPFGGLVGFALGLWLFARIGLVRVPATPAATPPPELAAAPGRARVSRPFAAAVLALAAGLAWWGWYEFIRSPYLSHGFMTLDLQIMLPATMPLPADPKDVSIAVSEGREQTDVTVGPAWHGHLGDRPVFLGQATLSLKTRSRWVSFALQGMPEQRWRLDLSSDPDPTPAYTAWRAPDGGGAGVEMNYRLRADR